MPKSPSLFSTPQIDPANTLALAQQLAQQLTIQPHDWHRLKNNRQAQAKQQLATALVYLLNDNPEEALTRIEQAAGWLNQSISALPCPEHGSPK